MKRTLYALVLSTAFIGMPVIAGAYYAGHTVTTPYWCGSYYSSYPCAQQPVQYYNYTQYSTYTHPAYHYYQPTYQYPTYNYSGVSGYYANYTPGFCPQGYYYANYLCYPNNYNSYGTYHNYNYYGYDNYYYNSYPSGYYGGY